MTVERKPEKSTSEIILPEECRSLPLVCQEGVWDVFIRVDRMLANGSCFRIRTPKYLKKIIPEAKRLCREFTDSLNFENKPREGWDVFNTPFLVTERAAWGAGWEAGRGEAIKSMGQGLYYNLYRSPLEKGAYKAAWRKVWSVEWKNMNWKEKVCPSLLKDLEDNLKAGKIKTSDLLIIYRAKTQDEALAKAMAEYEDRAKAGMMRRAQKATWKLVDIVKGSTQWEIVKDLPGVGRNPFLPLLGLYEMGAHDIDELWWNTKEEGVGYGVRVHFPLRLNEGLVFACLDFVNNEPYDQKNVLYHGLREDCNERKELT